MHPELFLLHSVLCIVVGSCVPVQVRKETCLCLPGASLDETGVFHDALVKCVCVCTSTKTVKIEF